MQEKKWIIYFDKNNINHCGSDWNIPTTYGEKYISFKIRKGDMFKPKNATSYVIATNYQFMHYDADYLWENLPIHAI